MADGDICLGGGTDCIITALPSPEPDKIYIGTTASGDCENLGETDEGNSWVAAIEAATQLAIAGLMIKAQLEAARAAKALADKYLQMAKEAREHYNNYYKPLEIDSVEWACSQPEYVRDKDRTQIGRAMLTARMAYKNKAQNAINCVSKYCSGLRATLLRDALLEEAQAVAAAGLSGLRYEKKYEDSMNDLRFDRRGNMLKIGRDMSANASELAKFASNLYGDAGDQSALVANASLRNLGYMYNRDYTPPPIRRTYAPNEAQATIETPEFKMSEKKEDPPIVITSAAN